MIRFLPILLFCAVANAAYVTIDVTFTNIPATGHSNTVNGAVARWTNGPLNVSTWIQTNGIAGSATNLWRFMGANYPRFYSRMTNATNVTISGEGLQFHITGDFGFTTTNSGTGTNWHALMLPWDIQSYATNRTNDADEVLYGLNKYARTNGFSETAQAMTNFFNRGQAQTGGNKTLTNSFFHGGGISNSYATNLSYAKVTNLWAESAVIMSLANTLTNASFEAAKLTNSTGTGTNWLHTDITIKGGTLSNAVAQDFFYIDIVNGVAAGLTLNRKWSLYATSADVLQLENIDTGDVPIRLVPDTQLLNPVTVSNTLTVDRSLTASNITSQTFLTSTNQFNAGTNTSTATIVYIPKAVTTFTDGYNGNGDFRGGGSWVKISGPSAAYTNTGWRASTNGARFLLQFSNPALSMAILNDSGLADSTNRIYTSQGGTVMHSTNNPVFVETIYDTDHWRIISFR